MNIFTAATIVLVLISRFILAVACLAYTLNIVAACISYRNATADLDAEYNRYSSASAGYQPQVYNPFDGQQPNMNYKANMNAPMLAKSLTDYPPGVNVL